MHASSSEEPSRCCRSMLRNAEESKRSWCQTHVKRKTRNVRTPSFLRTYCYNPKRRNFFSAWSARIMCQTCNAMTYTTLIVLGVHGFHPSSKGFDMLHSNFHKIPFKKKLSRKLSRTLSRKIKESMSQASQRFATTTLRAEKLQWMQRTSFCHGSHSCAWGGQVMNQFPELVIEDGCSEPSVSRGISKRHAFTHPGRVGWEKTKFQPLRAE